ncbi:MAG TPA: hypothetical protein VHZ03_30565 [Trebonia sp.]|jgi:hypothetical protein|nr:hypothetical protein [Trebonia sp.]
MTGHTPEAPSLRTRTLLHLPLDDEDDSFVAVDHVYLPEGAADPCEDCGRPAHDPGMVGLMVSEGDALMTAEQALVVANRLTRAASLVLESGEDCPDIEREAARYAAHDQDAAEGGTP